MGRFAPLLPELILSIGGTILMMVAAFAGRRGSALTSWLAVALLLGATIALIGAPSHAGPVFDGIVSADLFASFAKAIIFPAAAVAIIAAPTAAAATAPTPAPAAHACTNGVCPNTHSTLPAGELPGNNQINDSTGPTVYSPQYPYAEGDYYGGYGHGYGGGFAGGHGGGHGR